MKNRTLLIILWLSSFVFIIITVLLYYNNFNKNGLSDDPERWAQFADYFGGVLNPFISLLNLIILTYLSIRLVKDEDNRNRWTLQELARPYGEMTFDVWPEKIKISVQNYGLGPMIISEIIISDEEGNTFSDFLEIIKTFQKITHCSHRTFKLSNSHCAVGKDDEVVLLEISTDEKKENEKYITDFITKLKKYTLTIKYLDMYKRPIDSISDVVFSEMD